MLKKSLLLLLFFLLLLSCSRNSDTTVTEPYVNPTADATMTQHSFNSTSNGTLGYWLYKPKNATANMPLIIYLHGGSQRGSDLALVVSASLPKLISEKTVTDIPAYVLMPQCPANKTWEQMGSSVNEMMDFIVSSEKINIHKVSLTGHSLGGSGTWSLGADYAAKLSCIAPLSGSVLAANASKYVGLPVWAFVGSADTVISPASSTAIVPMINNLGGSAQIKIYDGATHFDIPDLVYKDTSVNLLSWMISKSKP